MKTRSFIPSDCPRRAPARFIGRLILAAAIIVVTSSLGTMRADAQTIHFSFPDTTAKPGDPVKIAVLVDSLRTADSVRSGQFTVTYDMGVLFLTGFDTVGTVLSRSGSIIFNSYSGTFAFANSSPVKGKGVLVYLTGTVRTSPSPLSTVLSFSGVSLNEGLPAVGTANGSFRARKMTIVPNIPPATVVIGDSLQFTISGDRQLPLVWSTSDASVGTVTSGGLFHAVAQGQVRVRVHDQQGLSDSTQLFAVFPATLRSLTVSVHDTSFRQQLTFNMPVYISSVTSLGIISSQFSLTYNASILQALGVVQAGTLSAGWGVPTFNASSGRVDIAMAGSQALGGSGVLVYVRFRVLPGAGSSTPVNLSGVLFNETIQANVTAGTFSPLGAPVLVMSPTTAVLTKHQTLQFSVTSGGTPPYTWSASDTTVVSIDPSSGLLTAMAHGTSTVTATDVQGFYVTSGSVVVNDVRAALPDTTVARYDSTDVPLKIDDVTGLGILSYELRLVYDSTKVRFLRAVVAGTLSSGMTIIAKDTLDTVRIAAAGSAPLAGGGILVSVRFTNAVTAAANAVSGLGFAQLTFNEPGPGTATATLVNGSLKVLGAVGVNGGSRRPWEFALDQNYPNPFNPSTNVRFEIGDSRSVRLSIFDVLGREVATLVNEMLPPGEHDVVWNAAGMPSGVYYCRMSAGTKTAMIKMILMR